MKIFVDGKDILAPPPPPPKEQGPVIINIPYGNEPVMMPSPPMPQMGMWGGGWGMPHFSPPMMPWQQQWWPSQGRPSAIVITNGDSHEKKEDEKKEEDEKLTKEEWKKKEEEKKKKKEEEEKKKKEEEEKKKKEEEEEAVKKYNGTPRRLSKFSVASAALFVVALILGTSCIAQTYQADYERSEGGNWDRYAHHRTVALALGCVAAPLFALATICAFFSAQKMRAKAKHDATSHSFLMLGSWIILVMTFLLDLIILVLAYEEDTPIFPFMVLVGIVGSIISWLLMFGYSEMARRWKGE
eukprot:CAMPEP_0172580862 /NCGR_PEP_ID=MMETSP1067-20121228/139977_1 /TAXON_ID=265564 ORGANISM="Thalassiosira punctigera, Strain Tpunct2005C2" /NCGR_SAMPLE_ID=MMETSP1067 /ASSEMBLY_ACC=CAM_ASM_000444 /LENGTH=297 /DNA_ID=CAMNT_0013373617 /DNA_START=57 /DNA_END=950 /DNA_ORIENTATION=-